MKMEKKQTGFTLIELMITLAIIGILAAVAIPGYIGYRLRADRNIAWTDLQTIRLLEEQFFAENGTYAGDFADTAAVRLGLPGFNPDQGSQYTYSVALSGGGTGFTATATRSAGNDPGSPWTITNNNIRNF